MLFMLILISLCERNNQRGQFGQKTRGTDFTIAQW